MARSKEPPPEWLLDKSYISVTELAREHNVTNKAIHNWVRRNKRRGVLRFYKRKAYLPLGAAAQYGASRSKQRPKGWPTRKSIEYEIDPDNPHKGKQFVKSLTEKGKIRCVKYKGVIYVHPDDAKYAEMLYRNLLPQAGWKLLTVAAKECNRTGKALRDWAKRGGVELRMYRHPRTGHPCHYIHEDDAFAYKLATQFTEHHKSRRKNGTSKGD